MGDLYSTVQTGHGGVGVEVVRLNWDALSGRRLLSSSIVIVIVHTHTIVQLIAAAGL